MKELHLNIGDRDQFVRISRALSSPIRLSILELLNNGSYNINEISKILELPLSTTAVSIKALEEAGLIAVETQPGTRGGMKLCSRKIDCISVNLVSAMPKKKMKSTYISMPIGAYSECKVNASCGLASKYGIIESEDNTKVFYDPKRYTAQLIWFTKGYLEYRVPINVPEGVEIEALEISLEICSEAPNYRLDWPSDISFWINGVEIGSWTSPGDLGGRRGRLNPEWWSDASTQYGLLKKIYINKEKTSIDESQVSRVSIADLGLDREEYLSFRIGVKDNAQNIGGINIFGAEFGDYPQDIVLKFLYY